MGMFDTFTGTCPRCKDPGYQSQTKLFSNSDAQFKVGDRVWDLMDERIAQPFNLTIELKNRCELCKSNLNAIIKDGNFSELNFGSKPHIREGSFGDIIPGDQTREEYESELIRALSESSQLD